MDEKGVISRECAPAIVSLIGYQKLSEKWGVSVSVEVKSVCSACVDSGEIPTLDSQLLMWMLMLCSDWLSVCGISS